MHTNKNYPQPQPQHPAAIQRHTWALTGFFFFFQFNSTLFTKHQIKTTAASSRSTTIFAAFCESLFHLCSNQLHDHTSLKYILHVYQGEQLVQKSVTNTHWPSTEGVFGWPLHPCWPLHSGTSCLQRTDTEHVYCRHVDKLSNYGLNKSVMSD